MSRASRPPPSAVGGVAPELVVIAADATDVARTVALAGRTGRRVVAQITGRRTIVAAERTILVVTRLLAAVRVDPDRRTATVGIGASWRQVLDAAEPFGLTALSAAAPPPGSRLRLRRGPHPLVRGDHRHRRSAPGRPGQPGLHGAAPWADRPRPGGGDDARAGPSSGADRGRTHLRRRRRRTGARRLAALVGRAAADGGDGCRARPGRRDPDDPGGADRRPRRDGGPAVRAAGRRSSWPRCPSRSARRRWPLLSGAARRHFGRPWPPDVSAIWSKRTQHRPNVRGGATTTVWISSRPASGPARPSGPAHPRRSRSRAPAPPGAAPAARSPVRSPVSPACAASPAAALSTTASRTADRRPANRSRATCHVLRDVAAAQVGRLAPGRCRASAGSTAQLPHRAGRGPARRSRWSSWSARPARRRRGTAARPSPARRTPRPSPAPSARLPQPIAPAAGWAGLVSGPRKLKTVGMPSSRRAAPACRNEGWIDGCEAEPDADLGRRSRATASAGSEIATPRPSSRSAAPHLLDAARLPCLTTGRTGAGDDHGRHGRDVDRVGPVAAGADDVHRPHRARSTRTACASMLSTSPATSAAVSPLARSATAKPASWAAVASPAMIRSITQPVSAASRCSPASSRVSSAGQDLALAHRGHRGVGDRRHQPAGPAAQHPGDAFGGRHRVERVHQDLVGPGPGGQPAVVGPADHQDHRRDDRRLLVDLPADSDTAGRLRLAVQDQHVGLPRPRSPSSPRARPSTRGSRPARRPGAGRRPIAVMIRSRTSGRWL